VLFWWWSGCWAACLGDPRGSTGDKVGAIHILPCGAKVKVIRGCLGRVRGQRSTFKSYDGVKG
jgi:hypothetical protein